MNSYFWLYIFLAVLAAVVVFFISLALLRLARTLDSTNSLIVDVRTQLAPLMTELRVAIEQINNELDTVDDIVQSVHEAGERVTATATVVQKLISSPLIKIASLSAGAKAALNALLHKQKQQKD